MGVSRSHRSRRQGVRRRTTALEAIINSGERTSLPSSWQLPEERSCDPVRTGDTREMM